MASSQRTPIMPGSADVATAVASGDAFLSHAQRFWALVEQDPDHAEEIAQKHIGELIASATTIALAIELYLKALLLQAGQPAPKTHDLPELYQALPSKLRQTVESTYDQRRRTENDDELAGLSVHIARRGMSEQSFDRPAGPPSMKLSALLKRNSNAFSTWRYLFAHGPTNSGAPLSYEYVRLVFAARAVRARLQESNHSG